MEKIYNQESEPMTIGKYGRQRYRYLKNYRKEFYQDLLNAGELENHLYDIDTRATDMVLDFMKHAEKNAPDKATDMMAWVGYMNNQKARAEEIINYELIYN